MHNEPNSWKTLQKGGFKILQQQNYVCVHIIRWSVMNVWLVPWRARITIKSHFQLTREHLFTDHTDTVCFQTALSLCALCGRCHTVYWGCCVLSEYYSQQSYILYTACSKHLNCSISTSFQIQLYQTSDDTNVSVTISDVKDGRPKNSTYNLFFRTVSHGLHHRISNWKMPISFLKLKALSSNVLL